jgi:serine/threonine protein phosphatase PrpC
MTPSGDLVTALLLGDDHVELEEVAIREIAPNLAIGISRGRFPKGYPHLDPNEDAVFAAGNGDSAILAVADGHQGFDAARVAITAIATAESFGLDEDPESIVHRLAATAIEAVTATIPSLPSPRNGSRTALTVAALHGGSMATATLGDTACFIVTKRRASRIGAPTSFLDPNTDATGIRTHTASLPNKGSVVVVSDGIVDYVADLGRPLRSGSPLNVPQQVEHLIAASFAGGAGDNVAVAVYRLHGA